MTTEHPITDEWISELLVTAFEGGALAEWVEDVRIIAEPLRNRRENPDARFDPEGEFDNYFPYVVGYGGVIGLTVGSELHSLTRSCVVKGLDEYVRWYDKCIHCLMEDHDESDANSIVQLGVLGDIVYDG